MINLILGMLIGMLITIDAIIIINKYNMKKMYCPICRQEKKRCRYHIREGYLKAIEKVEAKKLKLIKPKK